jgi:hypothetical protein
VVTTHARSLPRPRWHALWVVLAAAVGMVSVYGVAVAVAGVADI